MPLGSVRFIHGDPTASVTRRTRYLCRFTLCNNIRTFVHNLDSFLLLLLIHVQRAIVLKVGLEEIRPRFIVKGCLGSKGCPPVIHKSILKSMSAWIASDDEDSGDIFGSMYANREIADEKFYFKEVSVSEKSLTFKYSFCGDVHFESIVLLDMTVDASDKSLMRTVFSIGMCVCSWYWMGYYTPEIVIAQEVIEMCGIRESMMGFWEKLYHNVTLEYVYVNKLTCRKVRFVLEGGPGTATDMYGSNTRPTSEHSIIIPMGGKFFLFAYASAYV